VSLYNDTLTSLLDRYAPVTSKLVPDRPDCSWYTAEIREKKQARRRAERRYRQTGLEVHRQIFKQARNQVSLAIKQARVDHIQSELDAASSDPRKMYAVVDGLLGKDSSSPVMPDLDTTTAANSLAEYFVNKIKSIRDNLVSPDPVVADTSFCVPFSGDPLSVFVPVTPDELSKVIASSKPTSSTVDPVPTQTVLSNLDILLTPILTIINTSLETGHVPTPLKTAVIKPLLKKPSLDPSLPQNYRPVSNLPYISKLLERVVAAQLHAHLQHYDLLDPFQSAYRPAHSTETAVLRVLNDLLCSVDAGDLVLLALLDLSAAFDTIDHQLLLQRLSAEVGITGSALLWFSSYLTERYQHVMVGQSKSSQSLLTCGVPQGSVLGPVLFSLYTCQLGRLIESHCLRRQLFADDTGLYDSFKANQTDAQTAVSRVEQCCQDVKKWMSSNMLKLNDDKTEVIVCGSTLQLGKVELQSVQIGSSVVTPTHCVRDLGLFLDKTLSLHDHVSATVRACYFHLRNLSKLRPLLTKQAANSIAVSLVLSRLDYCNSCLWGLPEKEIHRLQLVQNTAARIVSRCKKTDHISPLLKELHWLPVSLRIQYKVLALAYQCFNATAPKYLCEIVQAYQPSRPLRSASQSRLQIPSSSECRKKRSGFRAFSNAAPSLWNDLPLHLRQSDSLLSFRRSLKTHLFSQL
jgi:hypothetical protein